MIVDCFLVISKRRGREVRVARVTQTRPQIAANEAIVRLSLDLPADIFDRPVRARPVTA